MMMYKVMLVMGMVGALALVGTGIYGYIAGLGVWAAPIMLGMLLAFMCLAAGENMK